MSRRSSRTARAPAGDELLSPSTIRAKAGPSQSTTTTSRSNSGSLHETRTAEGSANASGAAGKGSNKRGRSSRSASLNSTAQRPPEDGDTAVGGHDASPAETNMMHGDDDELDILGLEPANAQKSVKLSPNAARTGEDAVTGSMLPPSRRGPPSHDMSNLTFLRQPHSIPPLLRQLHQRQPYVRRGGTSSRSRSGRLPRMLQRATLLRRATPLQNTRRPRRATR